MSSVFFCKQAQSCKGMPHHIHSYAKHTFEHVGKMTPGLEAFFLFAREEGRQGGREDEGGLSCCRFPNLLVTCYVFNILECQLRTVGWRRSGGASCRENYCNCIANM